MREKRLPRWILPVILILILFYLLLPRHSFQDFTMDIFQHELSGNTLNLHYTLTDPEAYGIAKLPASFENFSKDTLKEELSYLKECQKQLETFQKDGISSKDRLTAELLDWWLDGQLLLEDYYYYQEPLGPTLGIQAQLPVLLAEFSFRNEEDIHTYMDLLSRLPEYFDQITAFEKEKSKLGLFMNDEILDRILAQCQSILTINNSHFLVTSFKERLESCDFLDDSQKTIYEIQNQNILNTYFVPAYQKLCRSLETLRGTGTNPYGLYHIPNGVHYFEYLLEYSVGTDLSIAEIRRMLEDQMETDYETILYALQQGVDLVNSAPAVTANDLPVYILSNLQKQIQKDFPETKDITFQVKEVPNSLSDFLSPAFFLTPPIDAAQQNTIYINPARSMDRNELITTLAHEGYPGHLYQNSFENQKGYDPVRNLFYVGGYTEGWGMYSEFYAYDFLGLGAMEAEALRALSSLNYAICASLDLAIHGDGWTETECAAYLNSFGITNAEQIHELYLNILEEPSNYLKYYLGYLEICNLKESALALSSDMTLYDFHKWFLEMGPAPFPLLKQYLEGFKVSSDLLQGPDENIQLLALEVFHDRLDHPLMESRVLFIGGNSLVRQGEKDHSFILCTADTGYVSLLHQVVDGGGQGSHGHSHGLCHGGHVFRLLNTDGVDDVHVIDGNLFKAS